MIARVTKPYLLAVTFLFLGFVTAVTSSSSSALEEHDPAIRSIIEENLYWKSAVKKLEEQFQSLSKLIISQKGAALSARTCNELMTSDPTLESGMHYIDPDGWNAGDLPVYVYCDKLTGETRVLHDSHDKTDVGHCFDPGCYSRPVNYNATMRQIRALMELSPNCDQYIRYDCVNAVFAFNNLQYSWWNDRQGNPKYYWHGSNDTVHTCFCGITGGCVEPTARCDCDASAPVPLYDEGRITNRDHLPITRLNFGRTSPTGSFGQHTLGPLRCYGSFQSSSGIPGSCADLWRSGETISGLYQIKGSDGAIVTVFCDMSKLPEETGHQTYVGVNDVKSTLVYFTAVREVDNYATLGIVPYDKALLNVGNAMNIQNGKFTAPKRGIYFFSLTINSSINSWATIYHNNTIIVVAQVYGNGLMNSGSAQATLQLEPGDVVYTSLGSGKLQSIPPYHHTHFTGYMLQEL